MPTMPCHKFYEPVTFIKAQGSNIDESVILQYDLCALLIEQMRWHPAIKNQAYQGNILFYQLPDGYLRFNGKAMSHQGKC